MGQIETWEGDCLRQNDQGVEGQIRERGNVLLDCPEGKWGLVGGGVATGNRMTTTSKRHQPWLVCNIKFKCFHHRVEKKKGLTSTLV